MSVNISAMNSQNFKQSFGVKISGDTAKYIVNGHYPEEARESVYKACEEIVGPKVFFNGIKGVLKDCAEAIKKQFPDIVKDNGIKEIDIEPLYKKTPETDCLLRRINTVRNASKEDVYPLNYIA